MKAIHLTRETVLNEGVIDRNFPKFNVGDQIEVDQIVKEGAKERIQKFEGNVIAFHNNGIATTFTVRKIAANSVGVERIFPYYSPIISAITLVRCGKVRRAKLFYIRALKGKSARIKERIQAKVRPTANKEKLS